MPRLVYSPGSRASRNAGVRATRPSTAASRRLIDLQPRKGQGFSSVLGVPRGGSYTYCEFTHFSLLSGGASPPSRSHAHHLDLPGRLIARLHIHSRSTPGYSLTIAWGGVGESVLRPPLSPPIPTVTSHTFGTRFIYQKSHSRTTPVASSVLSFVRSSTLFILYQKVAHN